MSLPILPPAHVASDLPKLPAYSLSFFIFAILMGEKQQNRILALVCISLITNDVY